ncbi:hypothetical protein [Erythrobacter sp.]|uniref:hypothetical protein n=1 Tax=Erythrobacter sp. TaxID=1042 RepID=UPI001425D9A4|nr:hypothetical protein [Erythrobacter sp.]QIQ85828.1 MAG: hypothetical protein G9473_03360 [Erythrobacter sp.]
MPRIASFIAIIALGLAAAQPLHAAEEGAPAITPLPLEFSAEGLSGPGAVPLREALPDAQFVSIGEDHGFAAAPLLVAAFAAEGRRHGFANYVIEVGPYSLEWMEEHLRAGGADALAAALKGRPLAIPFLSYREEAEVAADFVAAGGALWAVDQEFLASPLIHLEWFAARAEDAPSLDMLVEAEREAFAKGDQRSVFMANAGPELWAELREIFAGDDEALGRIDALQRSQAIYMANFTGRLLDNNLDRVALIRELFLARYRQAQEADGAPPKAILKMGATHAGRATSPVLTFDLGSLVEGIAAANGMEALHVVYLPLGGEQRAILPTPDGPFMVKPATGGDELAGVLEEAGVDLAPVRAGQGHYLIDLEQVRRALGAKRIAQADEMVRFIVLGFDWLVTSGDAAPATPLVAE